MSIIATSYKFIDGAVFTYVMAEGAIDDVAVYVMGGSCNIYDVARHGFKLTEKEAKDIFAIPAGKHYRR